MLVQEVMSRNIVSIDCNKTVLEACKVYSKNKVGSLVVMDKEIIVGIVTERDTIERVIIKGRDPKTTKVREYRKLLKIARGYLVPVPVPKTFIQRLIETQKKWRALKWIP